MSYYDEYRMKFKYAVILKGENSIGPVLAWCLETLGPRKYDENDKWEYAFSMINGVSEPVFFFNDNESFTHVSLKWG